jgi:signal transduction histidine kinase
MGASIYVTSIFFLAFFISFPRGTAAEKSRYGVWLPEIAIFASALSIVPWVLTATGVADLWAALRPGMLVMLAICLLGGVGILGWRLRFTSRENQEQLRIVTLGTLIGLVPFVWLSVIPMLVTGDEIILGEVAVLGFVLMPLSFGYAIMRHSLMGIKRLFHRTAAYALITAAIIIIYGSVLTTVSLFSPSSDVLRPIQISLLVALFAVAPMLSGVRRKAVEIVDRVLYQGAMEPQELVRTISAQAAAATDRNRTLSRSLQLIGDGMELEFAALVTHREPGNMIDFTHGEISPEVMQGLRALRRPGEAGVRRSLLPTTEQPVLLAPLHGLGGAGTTLTLGPKQSEEPYTDEDIRLVQILSGVLSTAVARLQLLAEVQAQSAQLQSMGNDLQAIQEEEREEISAYLHDEPLQKVAYALAQMRERALPADLAKVLEDVAKDLRNTSASLSPEMLRNNGLVVAVTWMVEEQERRGPFKTYLDIQGLEEKELIDEDIQLAAYRVIQEALNNTRKHADAKAVWVRIARTKAQLEVAVEDNGVGIESTMANKNRRLEEGLGLRGLRQRVSGLNGKLTVLPRASRGTAVIATIPLPSSTVQAAG